MELNFYIEECKMLRELAQHWELEATKAREEKNEILHKFDKLVQETIEKEFNERHRTFDHIFKFYQHCLYPNRADEQIDNEDVVYAFAQWVQTADAAILLRDLFGEKGAETALDEMIKGCEKWEEKNAETY